MAKEKATRVKESKLEFAQLIERIQSATRFTHVQIAKRVDYKGATISNALLNERKGKQVSASIITKLESEFKAELEGNERKMQPQTEQQFKKRVFNELASLKTSVTVIMRELAKINAHINGSIYQNELAALLHRTEAVVESTANLMSQQSTFSGGVSS